MSDILIVDDNAGNIDVLRRFLNNLGHRIMVAMNGEQALKTCARYLPEIILLDVMMPGIDGYETCERLKKNPLTQMIPVIFLTARNDTESLLKGFRVGGIDYVVKPFNQEEVLARINIHLQNRKLIKKQEAMLVELRQFKNHLEEKVLLRTQALTTSNIQLMTEKDKAIRATKLKDKFVSLVAHDLRSPLNGMQGYLNTLLEDSESKLTEDQRYALNKILACADQQMGTINGVLNISRLQTGKIVVKKKFIDGFFLIGACLDKLSFFAEQKKITLINNVPRYSRVFVDDLLFGEVLNNILSNAIKFSTENERIEITIATNDNEQMISIADHGRGIAKQTISKLFSLEEKVSTIGTAGEKGSGFGLPYSKDIMNAHQGVINVKSTLGEGSIFSLHFPFVKPNVLIVDDDRVTHYALLKCLNRLEISIDGARDGVEALEKIEHHQFHLIISDIRMPKLDGYALLQAIKSKSYGEDIPVILMTAYDDEGAKEKCFDLGGDDYITKPIKDIELFPRVRRYIGTTSDLVF